MSDAAIASKSKRNPSPFWFCTKTKASLIAGGLMTLVASASNSYGFHVTPELAALGQALVTTILVAVCKNKD